MFVALLSWSACGASEEEMPPPPCKEGLLACDIGCVDPQVNARHCGSCGNACGEAEECHEGTCAPLCTDGRARCGASCVNLESNSRHCGACGVACGSGEHCVEGSCEPLRCAEGLEVCNEACADFRTDPWNCGVCGRACAEGDVCSQGHCSDRCDDDLKACAGGCFDLQQDRRHCGDCGRVCSTGDVCYRGQCVRDCPEGRRDCGGACVDLKSDAAHCGSCHVPCEAGFDCVAGRCACPAGWLECGADCVDPSSSAEHCGGCNNPCRVDALANVAEATCEKGTCKVSCKGSFALCSDDWSSGCQVDVLSSSAHCGDCGVDCNVGDNLRSGACLAGACDILPGGCEDGWGDCNRQHVDGCETDLRSSIDSCGACGKSCLGGANVTGASCEAGACNLSCSQGRADCNKDPKDGCEHDVWTDPAHCGACGAACEPGERCVEGGCEPDEEWPNWPLPPDAVTSANYQVDGEVVTDRTTTLRWRKNVAPGTYTWANAKAHCPTLGAGWRLPTVIELLSIVKADASTPAIETGAFLGTSTAASANFWTATPSKKTPANGWSVNFASGATQVTTPSTTMQVRCVQAGEVTYGERRRVHFDDGTFRLIHDEKTGLLWFGHVDGLTYDLAGAKSYCGTRGVGGQGGFRLPTKRELESIVDRRAADPAIEGGIFQGAGPSRSFWSSTDVQGQAGRAWSVNFATGTSENAVGTTKYYVRCVKDFRGED